MKIGIIIAVLLLLAGGTFFFMNKKSTSPTIATTESAANDSNVFTSIQDALSKKVSLECTFSNEAGHQIKSYIKNGAVRSDVTGKTTQESGSTIIKDKKMYYWNSTMGFMMNLSEAEMQGQALPTTSQPQGSTSQQNPLETLEKYKNSCKPAVVSDNLFTPPTDVKFTDYSQMMKSIPTANPSGTMNQEDIQKMMEKYAPTGQ